MTTKTVVEIPKDFLDGLRSQLDKLEKYLEELKDKELKPGEDYLTINEFARAIKYKSTAVQEMASGTHMSGFRLKTYKRPNTRRVYVPLSEVKRWYEGK